MEQRKLLWIIFSATLFLLVVVGAGIIWLYPQPEEQPVAAAGEAEAQGAGADFDPIEWVRSDKKSPGLEERPGSAREDENFVVVYGENGEAENNLPTIESEEAEKSPELSEDGATGTETPSAQAPAAKETEVQSQPSPQPSPRPSSTRSEPETRTVRSTEYWIQTGSYTSRTRADRIKAELDRQGLTGRIMSKDVDGTLYYRVRIGPYQEKEEAQKFLTWVKEKEQFSSSYISQVYRNKTVVQ
ncbi:MAG: SPOR domain-containing protein [Spirochaetia bacterium]|nr:SPOR domain-containing protein [Spirochaetia bacterium]